MEVAVDPLLRKRNRNDRIQTEFMFCLWWVTTVNLRRKKFGTRSSSSSSLDDSRLCKIYNEYETCNMQREVLPDWLCLNQCLLIGKPPPPIPDQLSDVLPGWVWGCFTFYELESSRLSSRRSIRSGMREARKWNYGSKQCCCYCQRSAPHFREHSGRNPPLEKAGSFSECLLRLLSIPGKGPPLLISQTTKEVW